jgi:hypothetical protein
MNVTVARGRVRSTWHPRYGVLPGYGINMQVGTHAMGTHGPPPRRMHSSHQPLSRRPPAHLGPEDVLAGDGCGGARDGYRGASKIRSRRLRAAHSRLARWYGHEASLTPSFVTVRRGI